MKRFLMITMTLILCLGLALPVSAAVNITGPFDGSNAYTVEVTGGSEDEIINGNQYVLLVLDNSGDTITDLKAEKIKYIDQVAAADGKITFSKFIPIDFDGTQKVYLSGQGMASSPKLLGTLTKPAGVTVSGKIKCYPGNGTSTINLYETSDKTHANIRYSISGVFSEKLSTGEVIQTFSINSVASGTYDLVVSKAGHLDYTINGVVVGTDNIDLTTITGKPYSTITMLAGNVITPSDKEEINSSDVNEVRKTVNYFKPTTNVVNKLTDVNGDGSVNSSDVNVIRKSTNYFKGLANCTFDY